jgi:uncharacterized protein YbaR (Trm112 family)
VRIELLDILRCPFCGGRLELVASMFHRSVRDEIHEGILGCYCCIFPIVDGIPVLHLQPATTVASDHIEHGRPAEALRTMLDLPDEAAAERFEAAAASTTSTYKEMVEALGPDFEGRYFLYRFSDPTYVVANAVVRSVARTVLGGRRRAIDICGGSGHLTRSLLDLSTPAPVLADLFYTKIWLARRFTAPGCEPVSCDGNSPLPFARGAFGYAMCSDAFQYIWTKRLFIEEMSRLVEGNKPGAVVISHTHNQLAWSPSHGQPLPPEGYVHLFEALPARLYGETGLLADVVTSNLVDLSRHDTREALNRDPALTIVASRHPDVHQAHPIDHVTGDGEFRINPLYAVDDRGDALHLTLTFPDADYADEYAACRQYLPETARITWAELAELQNGGPDVSRHELVRRRVVLNLPLRYC